MTTTPTPDQGDERRATYADAIRLAKLFHQTYEELAPEFGYETRPETREFKHDSANGALMVEVMRRLLPALSADKPVAQPDTMRDLLEEAFAGLQWYRDMHPEDDSSADDEMFARIESALAAPQPSQGAQVLVPVEPTPEMVKAGEEADDSNLAQPPAYAATVIYKAMVAATPHHPASAEAGKEVEVAQWQKRHPLRTDGKWENTNEHDAKWWRDNAKGWEVRALCLAPSESVAVSGEVSEYQPKLGDRYWCIQGVPSRVSSHRWEGDRLDQLLRDTGRIFRTEADAVLALAGSGKKP